LDLERAPIGGAHEKDVLGSSGALEVVDVGVVDLRTEVKIVSGDAEYEHQD
jgi:hypothetical protein